MHGALGMLVAFNGIFSGFSLPAALLGLVLMLSRVLRD